MTLEEKLEQFPLPVAVHLTRNIFGSVGAVIAAVLPYLLLREHVADWLFILPATKAASFLDGASTSLQSLSILSNEWPFAEVRLLGWLGSIYIQDSQG